MMVNHKELSEKQRKIIAAISFLIFVLFCAAVTWFIGRPMINFVSEPEKFRVWVESHGIFGKLTFILMMILQVVIALIPGEPLEIGAGYAFGAVSGTILTVIGITLGSIIVFFLVRRLGIRFIEIFFAKKEIHKLKFLNNSKKRNILIFLVFFLPGTPKDLLTYFVGITDIKLSHFLILASIARLPSVITSTVGGSALGVEKYKHAIIIFAVTLLVSAIGWFIYTLVQRYRNN